MFVVMQWGKKLTILPKIKKSFEPFIIFIYVYKWVRSDQNCVTSRLPDPLIVNG